MMSQLNGTDSTNGDRLYRTGAIVKPLVVLQRATVTRLTKGLAGGAASQLSTRNTRS